MSFLVVPCFTFLGFSWFSVFGFLVAVPHMKSSKLLDHLCYGWTGSESFHLEVIVFMMELNISEKLYITDSSPKCFKFFSLHEMIFLPENCVGLTVEWYLLCNKKADTQHLRRWIFIVNEDWQSKIEFLSMKFSVMYLSPLHFDMVTKVGQLEYQAIVCLIPDESSWSSKHAYDVGI